MPSLDFNIKPLAQEEVDDFFFGRRRELDFLLNQITNSQGGKAFAISGRRGAGKSTLINKLITELKDRGDYLIVKVDVPKEFDEFFIVKRILRAVCEGAIKEPKVQERSELLLDVCVNLSRLDYQLTQKNEVGKEEAVIKAVKGSVNAVFANVGGNRSVEDREIEKTVREVQLLDYDLERVQAALQALLENLAHVFTGGIVIIVDETDKSNYVDAVKTLDNIKPLFWLDKCYYIFVGSQEFHEDYLSGIKTGKKTLLDSLFTRIVYLHPFGNEDLVHMLKLRIGKEVDTEKNEMLETIATLSKGNPRDAIRYCDLLVGECGSIEDARRDDLQRVIHYTFPHFPPGNLNHFIPLSLFISELIADTMDPVIESCAVSIVSRILELKPRSELRGGSEVFSCGKKTIEEAIVVAPGKKYGFSRTDFETALAFLNELGLVTRNREENHITLTLLDDPKLTKYEQMFKSVLRR